MGLKRWNEIKDRRYIGYQKTVRLIRWLEDLEPHETCLLKSNEEKKCEAEALKEV